MRLFVAVRPPPDVVDDLDAFLEPRRDVDTDLRWTGPPQWHLTLAFLPRVHEDRLDELVERLAAASARQRPFGLRVEGAGAFPDPARAKVLWMGVPAAPAGVLERLAVRARNAASVSGAPVDGTRFQPHLTVARLPRPAEATRWLRVLSSYAGPGWTADEVLLLESHLGGGHRPRHEVRAVLALG